MNVKGLKLTKQLICKIKECGTENLDFHGIETIGDFDWSGFSPNEFNNLVNSFYSLNQEGCFRLLPAKYNFVFNYFCNITEMDIITMISSKENTPVFLNIEIKNGDLNEIKGKLDKQLDKRIQSHLPQFLKRQPYILIGVLNNEFYKAFYFDGTNLVGIDSLSDLVQFINNNFIPLENNIEKINELEGMPNITEIFEDMKKGVYCYYDETNKSYRQLINHVELSDASFIYGNAGTGKTILALRFFLEHQDSKLLMLNSKLYNALKLNEFFSSGKAMFNSERFISELDKSTISIVDECQRLSIDEIKAIIQKSKHAIFFGDEKQAWQSKSTFGNLNSLVEILKEESFSVYKKHLTHSNRYNDNVEQIIEYLCYGGKKTVNHFNSNFKINIYCSEQDFINSLPSLNYSGKLYVPFSDKSGERIELCEEAFKVAPKTFDMYSLYGSNEMYGTTYHALSFDVDDCFVYLPDTIVIKKYDKLQLFTSKMKESEANIKRYENELYILFSRGKKSLSICVPNADAYLLLKSRLSSSKANSPN